jgi:peptidoglycan/LPS O-acetylase OafA/YrhL
LTVTALGGGFRLHSANPVVLSISSNPITAVPPAPRRGERFVFIDALRGLAALTVVLFHSKEGRHIDALSQLFPAPLLAIFHHGDLGVQVFFVLSGFVIAHSMARDQVTPGYVGRFLLRRSLRIDPPYWASMVLVVALGLLSARSVPGKVYHVPGVGQVVAHIFYLPKLLGIPLINLVYWTLCLEIQFYLVFALLMLLVTWLRKRMTNQRAFPAVIVPAAIFSNLWVWGVQPFDVRGLFLSHWYLFLAGVLVWYAVTNPKDRLAQWLSATNLVSFMLAIMIYRGLALEVGTAATLSILVAGRLGKLTTWFGARPLQFLGAISYSLYLIHNPITGALFRIGYRLTGQSVKWEAFWLSAVVSFCVLFAWLFYRMIEIPSLRLSHRIRLKGRALLRQPVSARVS